MISGLFFTTDLKCSTTWTASASALVCKTARCSESTKLGEHLIEPFNTLLAGAGFTHADHIAIDSSPTNGLMLKEGADV